MLSTHHKIPSPQCRWIRTERTMCAGFAARGRSGQQGRELHWSAPVKFAAVRSSPWLGAGPTSQTKHTHNTQDKGPTNKRPTNQTPTDKAPKTKGGQTQGGGGKNPRGSRELSSTQKVRNKFNTGQETEAARSGHENTRKPTKRQGGAKNQWKHLRSGAAGTGRGGQHKEGQNRTQTQGHQHKERRQGAGRQQRTGGGGARKDQSGYSHALVDVQRGTWNIKDEYLSAAAQGNAKTLQSGVEGRNTPHRAKPLVPQ